MCCKAVVDRRLTSHENPEHVTHLCFFLGQFSFLLRAGTTFTVLCCTAFLNCIKKRIGYPRPILKIRFCCRQFWSCSVASLHSFMQKFTLQISCYDRFEQPCLWKRVYCERSPDHLVSRPHITDTLFRKRRYVFVFTDTAWFLSFFWIYSASNTCISLFNILVFQR